MKNVRKIRLVLVDDHLFFRKSLKDTLKNINSIEVVGEANNGEEYLKIAARINPDVVLMDMKMNKMDGIDATRISARFYPSVKIIVLTYNKGNEYLKEIIRAGAKGIIYKEASIKEIASAVENVYKGNMFFLNENNM